MKIAISCGDVNGIGLEVLLKALVHLPTLRLQASSTDALQLQLIVHPQALIDYAHMLSIPLNIESNHIHVQNTTLDLIACDHAVVLHPGQEELSAARLAYEALERSADLLRKREVDAVVTLPVSKTSLHLAGFDYAGQTEFFAARASSNEATSAQTSALMILMHEKLRVALATVHVSLQSVSSHLSVAVLCERGRALHRSLRRDFGCSQARIAMLSLNPHAGENGHMGHEERDILQPALELLQSEGVLCEGPFASDGFFAHGAYKNYDGILAMYHDQGLIPLKLIAGGAGVNFSANLDVVRCSPDHGTAYALAGKNLADERSTVQAILSAIEIVRNRAVFDSEQ